MAANDCVFCRIAHEDPFDQVEWRTGTSVVIAPLNPVAPGHRLVIPLTHVTDAVDDPAVFGATAGDASRYARDMLAPGQSVNLITSRGVAATQSVFHLHLHIVPRVDGDGLHLPWTGQGAPIERPAE